MSEKFPMALPEGTVLAGQYIVEKVLGQGGFGITYAASDHKTGNKVAVKEFFPDTMATRQGTTVLPFTGERGTSFDYGKDRFLDEAQTLAQFIGNENIVRIHTYFEENGTAYFVMDFVEGTSFDVYIREHGGKLDWEETAKILIPIMDALGAVHSKGIVHRDVTPDNIYITKDGGVKLLDFGAARYSLGDKSRSLDVVLKHGFAPKEQYTRHGKQGPFTDIYALGATFYYALTGKRPPDSIDRMEEDELVPPSRLGAVITKDAEEAILMAMNVQPQERFQSMLAFKNAMLISREEAEKEKTEELQVRQVTEAQPIPVSQNIPASQPIPASQNIPTSQSIPVSQNIPASQTIPASQIIPSSQTIPASQTIPTSQTIPASQAGAGNVGVTVQNPTDGVGVTMQNPTDGIGATVAAGPGGPGNGAPMQAPPVKPKKKKGALVALLIIPVVAVIALVVLVVGILVVRNPIRYSMADSKLTEQDYDAAIDAFTALGDYKDSADKVKEAKYLKAGDLAKAGSYDEAIVLYEELKNYKKSSDKLDEVTYDKAMELMADKDYDEAEKLFKSLGNYDDSKKQLQEISFLKAEKLYADGDFEGAYSAFSDLYDAGYRADEAATYMSQMTYDLGCQYLDEGNYEDAINCFEQCGDSDKVNDAKWGYIQAHYNNTDTTTYEYLTDLYYDGYSGASTAYDELYAWNLQILGWNDSEYDTSNFYSSMSVSDEWVCHIALSGGAPGAYTSISWSLTINGTNYNYMGTIDGLDNSGDTGYASAYYTAGTGTPGTLEYVFYDENGYEIASSTVELYK
ncbi:MAG: protein kinase [Lachnospiraceae bacterium]|nr:protein kinase [Lachnospiraceae bacterium]